MHAPFARVADAATNAVVALQGLSTASESAPAKERKAKSDSE
jgi:hypothetical protein